MMDRPTRGLANERTFTRFKKWMSENCMDRALLDGLDIQAEFGKDLSYNEAIEMALHKFPTLWRNDSFQTYENKPKQIIFVKELVQRIIDGRVQVTYRKTPKVGTYYIIENRFKQKSDSARVLIDVYQTDRVDAYRLTDEEARLAGVDDAAKIRSLFEKWYGSPIPPMYRNWFRVKEIQNS
jgi:hypothetical protein